MEAIYSIQPQSIEEISEGQFYVNMDIENVVIDGVSVYKCQQVRISGNPTYSAVVEALIRERYSVSDELALLRQKDSKPADFSEYNTFCESCKVLSEPVFYPKE